MPVTNKVKSLLEENRLSIKDIDVAYNLTYGQADFGTPDCIKEAAKKAIDADKNGYIKAGGEADVKELLLENLAKAYPKVRQDKDNLGVIITSGVTGGLFCSLMACADFGDEVLIPDPYFSLYIDMVKLIGAKPVTIDTYPDFNLTAQRVEQHITPKTKLLFLTSPNNPSGKIIDKKELKKIFELCNKHDITIISDEIYSIFLYENKASSFFDISTQGIVLNGFSKSHAVAGWRIGYLIAPKHLTQAIEAVQGNIFVNPPVAAHYTIPAALSYKNPKVIKEFQRRRNLVIDTLKDICPDISCDGGFFVFFNVTDVCGLSASDFIIKLKANGVALLAGALFSKKDTHVRLSLTCEYNSLKQALAIIKNTLIDIRDSK